MPSSLAVESLAARSKVLFRELAKLVGNGAGES
jgi:hypothetical protein